MTPSPRNAPWGSNFAKSVLNCRLLHEGNIPSKFQVCRFNSSGDIVISQYTRALQYIEELESLDSVHPEDRMRTDYIASRLHWASCTPVVIRSFEHHADNRTVWLSPSSTNLTRERLVARRLFRTPTGRKDTIHLQEHMPSPGFEPRAYDTAVSVTNHYNGWAVV
ncbi:hypothetical protein TNCV_1380481 [Trichonephila clavipes]|nr:hypothetical protein TNCV_1380481 [Trichonephila clavipes]